MRKLIIQMEEVTGSERSHQESPRSDFKYSSHQRSSFNGDEFRGSGEKFHFATAESFSGKSSFQGGTNGFEAQIAQKNMLLDQMNMEKVNCLFQLAVVNSELLGERHPIFHFVPSSEVEKISLLFSVSENFLKDVSLGKIRASQYDIDQAASDLFRHYNFLTSKLQLASRWEKSSVIALESLIVTQSKELTNLKPAGVASTIIQNVKERIRDRKELEERATGLQKLLQMSPKFMQTNSSFPGLQEFTSAVQKVKEHESDLFDAVVSANKKVTDLQYLVQQVETRLSDREAGIIELRKINRQLELLSSQQQQSIFELTAAEKRAKEVSVTLHQLNRDNEARLAEERSRSLELAGQLRAAQAEIETLQTSFFLSENTAKELAEKMGSLEASVSELTAEKAKLTSINESLHLEFEHTVATHAKFAEELQQNKALLEKVAEKHRLYSLEKTADLEKLTVEHSQLEKDFSKSQSDLATTTNLLAEATKQITLLTQELELQKKKRHRAKEESLRKLETLDKTVSDSSIRLSGLDKKTTILEALSARFKLREEKHRRNYILVFNRTMSFNEALNDLFLLLSKKIENLSTRLYQSNVFFASHANNLILKLEEYHRMLLSIKQNAFIDYSTQTINEISDIMRQRVLCEELLMGSVGLTVEDLKPGAFAKTSQKLSKTKFALQVVEILKLDSNADPIMASCRLNSGIALTSLVSGRLRCPEQRVLTEFTRFDSVVMQFLFGKDESRSVLDRASRLILSQDLIKEIFASLGLPKEKNEPLITELEKILSYFNQNPDLLKSEEKMREQLLERFLASRAEIEQLKQALEAKGKASKVPIDMIMTVKQNKILIDSLKKKLKLAEIILKFFDLKLSDPKVIENFRARIAEIAFDPKSFDFLSRLQTFQSDSSG